jgi:hypothetical protein
MYGLLIAFAVKSLIIPLHTWFQDTHCTLLAIILAIAVNSVSCLVHSCVGPSNITLIYFLCSFIKAKSEVSLEDVNTLVEIGLELFIKSQNKLYAQVIYCIFE